MYPEEAAAIPQQINKMEKRMILATIRMTIPPQKREEVLKILRSMAEQCRDDPGCLSCNIYGDLQEKNVFVLEEVWRAEEDLNLHLRSGEYLNLLLVLEMSTQTARDQVRHHLEFIGHRNHRKGQMQREIKLSPVAIPADRHKWKKHPANR